MGFYDTRCLVTGLPLTANDPAVAVLLTRVGGGYRPTTLGLRGSYNSYGTIDGVREDVNAALIWKYAAERLTDGRLVVRADESLEPTGTVDNLLEVVERNQQLFFRDDPAQFEPVVALDGAVVHHALIYQPVWDALAASTAQDRGPVDGVFQRLFGESPIAGEIYQARLADVAAEVRQLGAVGDFLAARGLAWAPPGERRQHYPTDLGAKYELVELRNFVDDARRDAGDVEVLRSAIDEADRTVAEYEEEARWQEQSRDEIERGVAEPSAVGPSIADIRALMEEVTAAEIKRAVAVDEDGNVIEWPPAQ